MKVTNQAILDALKLEGPYPKRIADRLFVTVSALYKRFDKYPALKEAFQAEVEGQFDTAESVIMGGIKNGDARIALEFMKTKGKARGYSTRVETTGADGGPVRQAIGPDLENMTDDALSAYVSGLTTTAVAITGAKSHKSTE